MKQCLIYDIYVEALVGIPFPPEISTQQAQINYLLRVGLKSYGWPEQPQEDNKGTNAGQSGIKSPENQPEPVHS